MPYSQQVDKWLSDMNKWLSSAMAMVIFCLINTVISLSLFQFLKNILQGSKERKCLHDLSIILGSEQNVEKLWPIKKLMFLGSLVTVVNNCSADSARDFMARDFKQESYQEKGKGH